MIKVRGKAKNKTGDLDSLVIEIPKQFAISHGLPEYSLATLTFKNGKISSEVIPYSSSDEAEVDQFLGEFPNIDEGMRNIGD